MTTNADRVQPNETAVPLLHCADPEQTLAFWRALGFEVTYEQTRPYVYLAFRWSGFDLHYGPAPKDLDPAREHSGGCLVLVDAVAAYHEVFTEAMRRSYGKVLVKGLPRMTRYRAGASRFSIVDPSGNTITFIQRDEPKDVEYGGSKELAGLARVLDNARILREFKLDDQAAYRALDSGMRRRAEDAPVVEQAMALAALIELATVLDKDDRVPEWGERLRALPLPAEQRTPVREYVADPAVLEPWWPDAS
ncbi:glyoxalase [Micromonospora sp. M51]|uniref:Glyoxalase n=1 Tax=Micromonospora parva TaxID=1464048 RepID=A0ABW6VQ02_9ACTN|nr:MULTISPECIES: glyoxalase [Micromonospora]MBQ1010633.1 glyoxalase [Micromonospora sp. M51]MBQ1028463.1 glyoxalase [Micromonospora sp. C97]